MGKNYVLKIVDSKIWKQSPPNIQDLKNEFDSLQSILKKRKKKIERLRTNLKKIELETKGIERRRRYVYSELNDFQISYFPSVNPTTQEGNNYQWSINLKIGEIERKKYLGSNKNVRKELDEILGVDKYFLNKDSIINKYTDECREEIRTIIQKNLKDDIDLDSERVKEEWKNNELKIGNYFFIEL